MLNKKVLLQIAVLLGFSIIFAFAVNSFSPKGIALFGSWSSSQCNISAQSSDDTGISEIEDITIAKNIHDNEEAVFVDARSSELYKECHIRGAVSLPVDRFAQLIDTFKKKYPATTSIITYCSGRGFDDGYKLTQCLFDQGYIDVKTFTDGFQGWDFEGYPIE